MAFLATDGISTANVADIKNLLVCETGQLLHAESTETATIPDDITHPASISTSSMTDVKSLLVLGQVVLAEPSWTRRLLMISLIPASVSPSSMANVKSLLVLGRTPGSAYTAVMSARIAGDIAHPASVSTSSMADVKSLLGRPVRTVSMADTVHRGPGDCESGVEGRRPGRDRCALRCPQPNGDRSKLYERNQAYRDGK